MTLFILGAITAFAFIILFIKMDVKKVAGYDIPVDIIATVALAYIFAGTFMGMVTAIVGGLIISVFLLAVKYIVGTKKLTINGWKTERRGLFGK